MRNALRRALPIAGVIAACTSLPAVACIEPPEAVRAREIALLDAALTTFKLTPAQVATAKRLLDQSEALYQAKKRDEAAQVRVNALIAVGYTREVVTPPKGPIPAAIEPRPETSPAPSQTTEVASAGCGGDRWIAPKR